MKVGCRRTDNLHGQNVWLPPNCAMHWRLYPLTRLATPSLAIA